MTNRIRRNTGGLPVRTKDGLTDLDRPGSDIFATPDKRKLAQIPGLPVRFHSLLAVTGAALKRYREFVFYSKNRTQVAYLVAYVRK